MPLALFPFCHEALADAKWGKCVEKFVDFGLQLEGVGWERKKRHEKS
jgi:hypothetical protein